MRQASLFEQDRLTLQGSIELTKQSLLSYGKQYKHWAIAFSGGKDSTALVTVVAHLIETKQIPRPHSLTAIYADTRMELPPLHASAMGVLEEIAKRGFNAKIAIAPLDKRFLVYILGRGVPPPNNNSLRYCTRQIKVDPMTKALEDVRQGLEPADRSLSRLLMLTGVRQGESAVRDQRISISCSKNGSECGQGWFQTMTAPQTDTLAPILHWRVCQVWDWLTFEAPALGFPTSAVAEAYGGEEAEEINARTGCIGCPLASKDTALDAVIKQPQWAYLEELKRLRLIYEQMRLFSNRLQKDGTETKKDGSLVANPGRKGPLTLEARSHFLEKILQIQAEVNAKAMACDRPLISLINPEEESRIRELIALRTFPDGWSGNEPRGDILLPEVYPNGNKQLLLF
ncbi:phosphoadenosine phosphosulfate reductase domain-containing protein [Chroococcidiopsis sp.]|uniref:phosphoadenosine phosphosulfate reductase domain-containing protein n=1 Tax=Chroococcidiopsis sp. TaxID=3088168 RepID=UPI003F2F39A8